MQRKLTNNHFCITKSYAKSSSEITAIILSFAI